MPWFLVPGTGHFAEEGFSASYSHLQIPNILDRNVMNELFVIRGIERLFTVGFGGMSIFLGYRLFSIVVSERGGLAAQGQGWKIALRNVAPGVFFSFFGMVILSVALFRPLVQTAGESGASTMWANQTAITTDKASASEVLFALRQVESHIASGGTKPDLPSLGQVAPRLTKAKLLLADFAVGSGRSEWYFSQKSKVAADPKVFAGMSPADKEAFQWLDSVLGEP